MDLDVMGVLFVERLGLVFDGDCVLIVGVVIYW